MDYEKKYNEVLERAKLSRQQFLDIGEEATEIEHIFPELKENEDKMINRCISDIVRKYGVEFTTGIITKEKMLAWLEKQGKEQPKVSIWKHWKCGLADNGKGVSTYLVW